MRKSLQGKVIFMFGIIMIVSVMLCGVLIFRWHYQEAQNTYGAMAKRGASLTAEYLMDMDMEEILERGQDVGYVADQRHIQAICSNFELKYLYVYLPDIEQNQVTMIYIAASDAKQREVVEAERGFGKVVKRELRPEEIDVFTGKRDAAAVVVNNQYGNVVTWYDAFLDAEGNIDGLIGADVEVQTIAHDIWQHTVWTTLIVLAGLLIVLCILLLLLNRSVLKPIKLLSDYMENFAQKGNKDFKLPKLSSKDEIGDMTEAFQKMVGDIDTYVANISQMTAARERVEAELDVAQKIQLGMLPQVDAYDSCQEINLGAYIMPAREVGGDLYDFFFIDETHFCVLVGDVSGKGITAALFMSMTRTLLKDYLLMTGKPAEAMKQANTRLCTENPEGMFVTAFVGILDISSGEFVYANAGHNYPVIDHGKKEFLKTKRSVPLGAIDTAKYGDEKTVLEAGEEILMYTDGVTEAQTDAGELFGDDRLIGICSEMESNLSEQEKIQKIKNEIDRFVGTAEQFDDITMVSLKYIGG